jgi:O-acetyl-ADP-ribose deacetylase (regulator of RNase III)
MINFVDGNILTATGVDAIANPVNCVGVMGAGLAKAIRIKFPWCVEEYVKACANRTLQPGRVIVSESIAPHLPHVIHTPTKRHWRDSSRLDDVVSVIGALRREAEVRGYRNVAIPPLGCGLGGLKWFDVKPAMEAELRGSEVVFSVFTPR